MRLVKNTIVLLTLLLGPLFFLPKPVNAQTCSSLNGHCTIFACANGNLPAGDASCFILNHCCLNASAVPTSCSSQGGHCVFSGTCANGSSINATDCTAPGFRCCPNLNSTGSVFCHGTSGINTAIGCLDASDPKRLTSQLLSWGTGIAGGIAFILIIVAGFQLATSAGDLKRVKAAQELLTSALSGLILIVLAVLVLNFIGITVLNLGSIGFSV